MGYKKLTINVLIPLIIVYIYFIINCNKADKKKIKKGINCKSSVKKMILMSRDAGITGGIVGLITGGPGNAINNAVMWMCVGGIKHGISEKLSWNTKLKK